MKAILGVAFGVAVLTGCYQAYPEFSCSPAAGPVTYKLDLIQRPGGTCQTDASHVPEQSWDGGKYLVPNGCYTSDGSNSANGCFSSFTVHCPGWTLDYEVSWSHERADALIYVGMKSEACSSEYDGTMAAE